jgi:hypothetical protein
MFPLSWPDAILIPFKFFWLGSPGVWVKVCLNHQGVWEGRQTSATVGDFMARG